MGRQARTKQIRRQIRKDVTEDMIKSVMGSVIQDSYDHDQDIVVKYHMGKIVATFQNIVWVLSPIEAMLLVRQLNLTVDNYMLRCLKHIEGCKEDPYTVPENDLGVTSVELTDDAELFCIRIKYRERDSVLFHTRSVVDLAQKIQKALCDWVGKKAISF